MVANPGAEQVAIAVYELNGDPNQELVKINDQLLEHHHLPIVVFGLLLGVAILTHAGVLF